MKTLFWTGAVTGSSTHGQAAIWRWWNYYRAHESALGITHWAVFNDDYRNLPVEFFVTAQDGDGAITTFAANRLNLVFYKEHLGRRSAHLFPGFWRNLLTAIRVCKEQDFGRFILCEYDCFILSADMLYEIGVTHSGLVTYWCPTYGIPESAIVICGKDKFDRLEEQARSLQAKENPGENDRFEVAMDWTEVRKHRKGDRYVETNRLVPMDAEYHCQLPVHARLAWGRIVEVIE